MTALLSASPSPGSLRAAPLTADEIDRHPDADRIWATVSAAREEMEDEMDRLIDRAEEAERQADAHGMRMLLWLTVTAAMYLLFRLVNTVATAGCEGCM